MDVRTHTKDLEQETTYDRIRKRWIEKVTGVPEQQPHNLPAEMVESITEDPQTSGWALKMAKKASTMSAAVKAFLVNQFNIGVNTGHKVDPDTTIAKHMKTARKMANLCFSHLNGAHPSKCPASFPVWQLLKNRNLLGKHLPLMTRAKYMPMKNT